MASPIAPLWIKTAMMDPVPGWSPDHARLGGSQPRRTTQE